ncbi:MFS transporter [Thalassobaculum fulvum]|jgi:MFS family permease|uniref:MFS transporter n=1 Tax=Thalassobaculum fulvum TaxID=1633335 RepID=A0A919CPV7_9PROT|nr:MFS transporter [Thalassobaculum fulvum]GHD45376.1 MFS transporter [Thalassobaculum fulvum]
MSSTASPHPAPADYGWRTPLVVILAGCLIAMVGFGIRSVFGLFLEPMTVAHGWDRSTFGLAMAIQNLLWGVGVPIAGMIADRYGPSRVLAAGAVVYAVGVWGFAHAGTAFELHLFGGVLTGLGVAFTAFSLAMAAMAKVVGPERRSLALGLGTASGSFGQVVFSPLGQAFIHQFGWEPALGYLALSALLVIPLAFVLPNVQAPKGETMQNQSLMQALREASGHRGYVLLTVGFFVCGFHVAFITVHFPAYVTDLGLDPAVGATALALVGFFNIAGSFGSGMFGQRFSKKTGLAWIYFLRSVAIVGLLLAPKTDLTIYLFAGAMGLLWLSTVPLTTGIVAQVFGVRYMATLFGVVFLSHQLGSFLGVWLGGYLYDTVGSYDGVWWAGVALGLVAAGIHVAIDEKPLARLTPATA